MIECPNCKKENSDANVFCIYCGSRISRVGNANEEIASIRRILADLNRRVNALEGNIVSGIEERTSLPREVPDPEGVSTILVGGCPLRSSRKSPLTTMPPRVDRSTTSAYSTP